MAGHSVRRENWFRWVFITLTNDIYLTIEKITSQINQTPRKSGLTPETTEMRIESLKSLI